jgi:type I restriction enzyme S subunit
MTAAIDITKEQRKTLLALLRRFIPGVAVWAYGSRVKWTARPNSDLDLVAFTAPAQSHLVAELKEALGESNLPFLVDFHIWDEVPERFHEIIRKEYVVLQDATQLESDSSIAAEVRHFGQMFAEPTRNGLTRPKAVRGSGVKMVNMGELFAYPRLCNAPMDRVPLSDAEAEKFLLVEGDLLFARQSLVLEGAGKCSIFLRDTEPVTFESHITRVRLDANKGDPQFYFYYLQSHHGRAAIRSIVEQGAGASGIRGSDLQALNVQWRPIDEQRAIAHILGTLDDKIELNRRMNATLEAMARALFQSWFVDFDPVRAILDGRKPAGLDAATTALFPAHFQDSLLGHIPQGWEVCPLADKIELLSGGTPKTGEPDYWNGDIPWFSVKDAPAETDVWVIYTEKSVTELGIGNSAAQVFPEKTTIITARGTVGKLALTGTPMAMNQSCYGVRGIAGYGDYFTYYSLRAATAQLKQHTHGTVFDTITRQTFETLNCVFPPPKLTAAFDRAVEPLLEQIRANLQQSRTLATIRDALLPKLLSGELSVKQSAIALETT